MAFDEKGLNMNYFDWQTIHKKALDRKMARERSKFSRPIRDYLTGWDELSIQEAEEWG